MSHPYTPSEWTELKGRVFVILISAGLAFYLWDPWGVFIGAFVGLALGHKLGWNRSTRFLLERRGLLWAVTAAVTVGVFLLVAAVNPRT